MRLHSLSILGVLSFLGETMKMSAFVWGILFASAFSSAQATSFVSNCGQLTSEPILKYCVHTPAERKSNDIVYYLHGAYNSELTWQDDIFYTAQIRQEWENKKLPLPTVISVSYGPLWILNVKNSSPVSGLLEAFTEDITKKIEKEVGPLKGRRIVFGDSMGGYNSVQLAFKTKLFAKAAILCTPMSDLSPFASDPEIEAHVRTSSAYKYYYDPKDPSSNPVLGSVKSIINLVRAFYGNQDEWNSGDPLQLAAKSLNVTPKLYVAAGLYDKFAVYEGNVKFVSILKSRNVDVDWRPQWGGHCSMDIPSLAKFLVE